MKPTREQILAEPAGRILDTWVAEFVMEITPIIWDENTEDYYCPYCKDRMRFCGERSWCSTCREWRYSPYQEYSDDIAAAWQVVEKMCQSSRHVEFNLVDRDEMFKKLWLACFYTTGIDGGATAETAPLAVCRAALLAVLGRDK